MHRSQMRSLRYVRNLLIVAVCCLLPHAIGCSELPTPAESKESPAAAPNLQVKAVPIVEGSKLPTPAESKEPLAAAPNLQVKAAPIVEGSKLPTPAESKEPPADAPNFQIKVVPIVEGKVSNKTFETAKAFLFHSQYKRVYEAALNLENNRLTISPIQEGTPYYLMIDPGDDHFVMSATTLCISRDGQKVFGEQIAVEIHSLMDFQSISRLENYHKLMNSFFKVPNFKSDLSSLQRKAEGLYHVGDKKNELQGITDGPTQRVCVQGIALSLDDKLKATPYAERDFWIFDRTISYQNPRSLDQTAVADKHSKQLGALNTQDTPARTTTKTTSNGTFAVDLPVDTPVYILFNNGSNAGQLQPPLLHEICPDREGFDGKLAVVTNSEGQVSNMDIGVVLDKLLDQEQDQDRKDKLSQIRETLVTTKAPAPKMQTDILVTAYGEANQASDILRAARTYTKTRFWAIARPDRYGVAKNWQANFRDSIVAQTKVDGAVRKLSNFRLIGYVSLFNEKGPKTLAMIENELNDWNIANGDVTGVFLDNFAKFPKRERLALYKLIKNKTKRIDGFTVFGAYGSQQEEQDYANQKDSDVLCLQKSRTKEDLVLNALADRIDKVSQQDATAKFAVMACGQDVQSYEILLRELDRIKVGIVCLSDFVPSPEASPYDREIVKASFWDRLCKTIDDGN